MSAHPINQRSLSHLSSIVVKIPSKLLLKKCVWIHRAKVAPVVQFVGLHKQWVLYRPVRLAHCFRSGLKFSDSPTWEVRTNRHIGWEVFKSQVTILNSGSLSQVVWLKKNEWWELCFEHCNAVMCVMCVLLVTLPVFQERIHVPVKHIFIASTGWIQVSPCLELAKEHCANLCLSSPQNPRGKMVMESELFHLQIVQGFDLLDFVPKTLKDVGVCIQVFFFCQPFMNSF